MAAIGYCFGGAMVLELARDGADLKAVVGFHPGIRSPEPGESSKVEASVLMCCGSEDPVVSFENRQAFEVDMRSQASPTGGWRSTAASATASPTHWLTSWGCPDSPSTLPPTGGRGGPCSTCWRSDSSRIEADMS